MITNPSCQTEPKESEGKFHAPSFEDDLGELGGGGGGGGQAGGGGGGLPPGNMTDLSGYGNFVGQPQPQHQAGHYNGHYGSGYNWHHQSADYYSHYTATNPQQGYYGGAGGGGGGGGGGPPHHYQHNQYGEQWSAGGHQGMVVSLPPGPSPGSNGSNNSPSPHGFSDTNEDHRADLKRPSPDSFVPHTSLGPGPLHHAQSVPAKKPKVSKRRKKRDPNEPQKPVSAYALFFRDTQASIKLRNPNANFGEVSKIVAATWDALDPDSKAAYKKRTEMAKKEYLRALAAYRANLVSKVSKCQKHHKFLAV